jgi:hypothetical protein
MLSYLKITFKTGLTENRRPNVLKTVPMFKSPLYRSLVRFKYKAQKPEVFLYEHPKQPTHIVVGWE